MKILSINDKPNVKNFSHNAFLDSIMSAEWYSGKKIAEFIVNNEYKYKTLNSSVELNEGRVLVKQEKGNCISKAVLYRKVSEDTFKEKVIILYQRFDNPWSGFNMVFSNRVDFEYEKEEKNIVKIGNPSMKNSFIKVNRCFETFFDKLPVAITPVTVYIELKNRNLSVEIEVEKRKESYLLELTEVFGVDDFYFQILIEPFNDMYENYFYSNYIQMAAYKDQFGCLLLDYYNKPRKNYKIYQTDYMFEMFTISELFNSSDRRVVRDLYNLINKNMYVIISIDQFYVCGSEVYNKHHHMHEMLIYGVDKKKKHVYLFGFVKYGKLERIRLNFSEFMKAVSGQQNNVVLIKYHPEEEFYNIDRQILIKRFSDYINGEDSYKNVSIGSSKGTRLYGINILREIKNDKLLLNNITADVRMSYTLYEHKVIMKKRIKYLMDKGLIFNPTAVVLIDDIIKNVERLKNGAAYYELTGKRKIVVQDVISIIEMIITSEEQLYSLIIKDLENEKE